MNISNRPSPHQKDLGLQLILLVFLFLAGCAGPSALHPGGRSTRALLNKKSIFIPFFSNTTFEPILEKELTRIFKKTFLADGWDVENTQTENGSTLWVQITRFSRTPTTLTLTGSVREYQIKISLKVRLMMGSENKEAYAATIEGISDYIARSDSARDRASKDRAVREAGREMAEQVSAFLQQATKTQGAVAGE